MGFAEYFPVIRKLTPAQRKRIEESVTEKKVPKGTVIHDGTTGCTQGVQDFWWCGLGFCGRICFQTREERSRFTACLNGMYVCFPHPAC